MELRGKFGFWLVIVLAVLLMIFAVPALSKSSWFDAVGDWFEQDIELQEIAEDEDDVPPADSMMVRVDDDIGAYSGVETVTLVATSFTPESKVLAKVVDLRPMLALRARHNQALAALNVAKVAERSAAQELARLKLLAKGAGSVATKNVNYAQATWNEAKAKLQGLKFELQAVRDETLQTWGQELTEWILAVDSKQWQRLLSHQDSLLLVRLPAGASLSADVSIIRIAVDKSHAQARKAYFVSPALATDQQIQGEAYFFKTASGKLRTGMRLTAWIPQGNEVLTGVFVSDQAVVWYAGQAWAYIKVEENLYQRRSLKPGLAAAGGMFMLKEIEAGEAWVVRGAQMLLSEEFRWQILDEDDDDD